MMKNVYWSSCKVPVITVRFSCNLAFLDSFWRNAQISNFMKIRPVGAELFHADRRTDVTKIIVAFRNFANASKKIRRVGRNHVFELHVCLCPSALPLSFPYKLM